MNPKYFLFTGLLFVALAFFGCSQKNVQALEDDIARSELEFKEQLDALIQRKNSLQVVGRALTFREQQFVKQVDDLENEYQVWRSAEYPATRRSYRTRLEGLQSLQERAKELMELEKPEVDLG